MKSYKVTEINSYINKTLSTDIILSDVSIEGEISNFTHHYSGHMYFNLKDENSRIKCVMFKSFNKNLLVDMEEGKSIVARGNISVYERDGVYQLYVKEVEENGMGNLYKEFEKLKALLDKEGLFAVEHKQRIPKQPKKIGIVTSATGAAVKDIITVIKRRFPATNILIYPSLVQGKEASETIVKGLKYLDEREDVDLIIFGRGGGSMEELFAFNDETLARTIFALKTPSISAVGHEIDFTIADFVADLRAATPSAAAEIAVPDVKAYLMDLNNIYLNIGSRIKEHLNYKKRYLDIKHREIKLNNPYQVILNKKQDVDNLYRDIVDLVIKSQNKNKTDLIDMKNRLSLVNPKLGIEKGYGIITSDKGKIINSVENIKNGETINVVLRDGSIKTVVDSIIREDTNA